MGWSITARRIVVAGALTAAATAYSLAGAQGSIDGRLASGVFHGLLVAVPTGIAIAVLARHPEDRFARVLYPAGLCWAVLALTDGPRSLPYSIGRVGFWLLQIVVVYLLLVFPSGRLTRRSERLAVLGIAVLVATLYVPSVLIVQSYPLPFPGATCGRICPHNAFALTSSTPDVFTSWIAPIRITLASLVFAAPAVILTVRAWHAPPLLRRALAPVATVAALMGLSHAVFMVARAVDPAGTTVSVTGWLFSFTLSLTALGFGAGLLARKVRATVAVQRLGRRLAPSADPLTVERAIGETLEDPRLRILQWQPGEPGRWVDETGWPVPAPEPSADTAVLELRAAGRRIGAIVHDATLAHDGGALATAGSFAVMALEHRALVERLETSLEELGASRARIAAVADDTRRHIERDLHDGAQQRLIALRLKLAMLGDRLADVDPESAQTARGLGDETERAIDEVRALARGIFPSILADRGLVDALASVAHAAPIPTTVHAEGIGRYRPEVESAVYFACVEAVQNAAKHARGAREIAISLRAGDELRFEVVDDGIGDESSQNGEVTSLRDRIRAIGGDVVVAPNGVRGMRVRGTVPLS